jgi:hypothetical protein
VDNPRIVRFSRYSNITPVFTQAMREDWYILQKDMGSSVFVKRGSGYFNH